MADEKLLCAPACGMHYAHERAINSHDKRLDSHGEDIDKLNDCITRLTVLQEQTLEWQKSADDRISNLESVPAKRWNESVSTLMTAAISAVVGAVLVMAGNGTIGGV